MGTYTLSKVEKRLCAAIRHGDRFEIQKDEADQDIRAAVIRHIVIGLPLIRDGIGRERIWPKTALGISIKGARIRGRLALDSAIGEGGSPVCQLEFTGCHFEGGFSGRHSSFSRLSLNGCTFGSPAADAEGEPTIDLSGAEIGGDLDMDEIRPDGDSCLWINAAGIRIDGDLNLGNADLRAPRDSKIDALHLSLAEVHGDLQLRNGFKARGRIRARGAKIDGDVWMTGAHLDGAGQEALVLQSAKIGGVLLLEGRKDDADRGGEFRRFLGKGEINLHELHLSGGLRIGPGDFFPSENPNPTTQVPSPMPGQAPINVCLRLVNAKVGSVSIGSAGDSSTLLGQVRLAELEVKTTIKIVNVWIGLDGSANSEWATVHAGSLTANEFVISDAQPLELKERPEAAGRDAMFSVDLSDAELGRLTVENSRLTGFFKASALRCAGNVVLHATVGGKADFAGANIGGSLDLSQLRIEGADARLLLNDGTIARALRLARWPKPGERAGAGGGTPNETDEATQSGDGFKLQGVADLRGLTCDILLDQAGESWGREVRLKMNRFVYRQASWHPKRNLKGKSQEIVFDWILAKRAEWRWPSTRGSKTGARLAKHDYWTPWQVRRNWLYQQFYNLPDSRTSNETGNAASPPEPIFSDRKIKERHYRPQPFEQVIRVARAEGREDFATHFEMLKQAIEWRFFNRLVRWWLAIVAISLATVWLLTKSGSVGSAVATGIALIATICSMIWASWIREKLFDLATWFKFAAADSISRWLARLAFCTPAIILYFAAGWNHRPFHFVVALFIFLVVRLISLASHGFVWIGFGYLRRPVRAIGTLIGFFLLGWVGVHVAKENNMLVVAAQPVAGLVGVETPKSHVPEPVMLMGSQNMAGGSGFIRDVSCSPEISEPLYALDILVPLIDLREEARCEIRHVPVHGVGPPEPEAMVGLWGVVSAMPALTIENYRFWMIMKVLYAILGWFIVSLSILTFAQANRAHAEPPTEKK